ncbi:hypothetical protein MN608_11470 [Microdochium nivale]|nr:hypothetical protein MN608_11470 [Microdochium nivale]
MQIYNILAAAIFGMTTAVAGAGLQFIPGSTGPELSARQNPCPGMTCQTNEACAAHCIPRGGMIGCNTKCVCICRY